MDREINAVISEQGALRRAVMTLSLCITGPLSRTKIQGSCEGQALHDGE
jgi:hypothetical protein